MANLLYYFPGINDATVAPVKAAVEAAGLLPVFGDAKWTANKVMAHGPDGGAGIVLSIHTYARGGEQADALVLEGRQTWTPCDEGKYWIGWRTDKPPAPADLARREQIAGHAVKLGDGNEWIIPLARVINGGTEFPKRLTLGPGGMWVETILPQFVEFCAKAESVWRGISGAVERADDSGESKVDAEIGVDDTAFAIEALALNYAVGSWEASALGLLTTHTRAAIIMATVDWPRIVAVLEAQREEQKKNGEPTRA